MQNNKRFIFTGAAIAATASVTLSALAQTAKPAGLSGWFDWRGPIQSGAATGAVAGLPEKISLTKAGGLLWSIPIGGGGTPIIANGKVYALGYSGAGADLQEVLLCADAKTGKILWQQRFNDFLSDITYDRYTIGSPTVDAETGNVYALTSAGEFVAFTSDGKPVFRHSMMEELGRLTFTNGRTGGPVIEDDLVIVRGITSNWGGEGAAQDRLYAFDKKTGGLVWSQGSGVPPKDNSFARPVFGYRNGKRVLYTGAGDGSLICLNARTGEPIWRYPLSAGGMNASPVLYKDMIVAIHADENLDSSDAGRMTAVNVLSEPKAGEPGTIPLLDKSAEAWRNNDLAAISSSPVLVGARIYQTTKTGQLACVDAATGKKFWEYKLAPDQLHASPTFADGKLYAPMQNGSFFVLKPKADNSGVTELSKVQLAGRCIGAPSVADGKVFVFSTEKLYCFGKPNAAATKPMSASASTNKPNAGTLAALQIVPSEVALKPNEKAMFTVRGIDKNGLPTGQTFKASEVKWEKFVPPTARVKSEADADFNANGELVAAPTAKVSGGAFRATINGVSGIVRGRVLPALPYREDFESFTPTETMPNETDKYAYPPLPWIGARFKFDVRALPDGNKVFAKTLDNIFFQRATVFLGRGDEANYTMTADVMSDGNRRTQSSVGLVNQRYYFVLSGNSQELEINSNQERIKAVVPFAWQPKVWYTMKSRVDIKPDGTGVVLAKCWKKGEAEPATWTLTVPHKTAHKQGSPGLFSFAPQSLFKAYIDNIVIAPNG